MKILNKSTIYAIAIPTLIAIFPTIAQAEEEPACPFNENRRGICGNYTSEISPAEAFLKTVVNRGKRHNRSYKKHKGKHSIQPVIIDVRSTPEYRAGHPEHSYNVPSPYIYQYCNEVEGDLRKVDGACVSGGDRIDQPPEDFVAYVESILPNKDTPIYTLCRTGVRSVGAAELLSNAGYTNVRNIWEGFVGINLTAPFQDENQSDSTPGPVDLNHDGELTDEDKNGWRNHQGLPYETRLLRKLKYKGNFADSYYWD